MTKPDLTIGVFDSGVGGLTVLRELTDRIPTARFLYFGDTARLPYGSKSVETVARYAVGAARFLHQQGAEMLVIACNTATALALDQIRAGVPVPVEGVIEPGAEAASAASLSRRIMVIGTEATVQSHAYLRALEARGCAVLEKACPLLVPLVEEGWLDHPVTEQVAHIYLDEELNNGESKNPKPDIADVLVLGCTHYPLLGSLLRRVVPSRVAIVDSAASTARAVETHLQRRGYSSHWDTPSAPRMKFFATDSVEKFRRSGERFLGRTMQEVVHVDLSE